MARSLEIMWNDIGSVARRRMGKVGSPYLFVRVRRKNYLSTRNYCGTNSSVTFTPEKLYPLEGL